MKKLILATMLISASASIQAKQISKYDLCNVIGNYAGIVMHANQNQKPIERFLKDIQNSTKITKNEKKLLTEIVIDGYSHQSYFWDEDMKKRKIADFRKEWVVKCYREYN